MESIQQEAIVTKQNLDTITATLNIFTQGAFPNVTFQVLASINNDLMRLHGAMKKELDAIEPVKEQ